jgi:hypothetical protein
MRTFMRRAQSLWSARLAVGAVAVIGSALWSGCGTDVPIRPTYKNDIAPLMEAHCIRCHGAGGMLNGDPDSQKVDGVQQPANGDFTSLQNDAAGHSGLAAYTNQMPNAALMKLFLPQMPPPPAPPLTDWEHTLLETWLADPLP